MKPKSKMKVFSKDDSALSDLHSVNASALNKSARITMLSHNAGGVNQHQEMEENGTGNVT